MTDEPQKEKDFDLEYVKTLLKNGDEFRFFPDTDLYEWTDEEGNLHKVLWMDIIFSGPDDFHTGICVITQGCADRDERDYGEPYEESEWEVVVDVPFLTEESVALGVEKWFRQWYPELDHVKVLLEDREIVEKCYEELYGRTKEYLDEIDKGEARPWEEVKAELGWTDGE